MTSGMLLAASEAVAAVVDLSRPGAGLLPEVENLRTVSATVAVAVDRQAASDGMVTRSADPAQAVQDAIWQAVYRPWEVK